ncbi:MAG: hypothetical protein LBP80_02140, partial [Treponema sp.]|nr:hypothetical protein [Treponema sp.]
MRKKISLAGGGVYYRYNNLRVALAGLAMLFLVACILFPFFWLITASIKPQEYIISNTFYFLPPRVTLDH